MALPTYGSQPTALGLPFARQDDFARPYVVSWNLTYRCNLACEHCYLDAGKAKLKADSNFADRSELNTEQCYAVIDQIASFAPESLTILTGGEPLLRKDILEIVRYANEKELWVVVGTNGVKISENLAQILRNEGVRGMALSLDALDPRRHDLFRRVTGAWENTVNGAKILASQDLPFIVQTTIGKHNAGELESIADFAYEEMGARVWNLYFLVPTGRGQFVSDMTPEEYDEVLAALARIQRKYQGKMVANAKCAPHFIKTLFAEDPDSPFIKTYTGGAGGCPAGTHYMGIRPNGDITPCPYLPQFGGNLKDDDLSVLWNENELFQAIRQRNDLGGRCGSCEFGSMCGGCRARAYGATGDVMAEDPLCNHTPGQYTPEQVAKSAQLIYGAREAIGASPTSTAPSDSAAAASVVGNSAGQISEGSEEGVGSTGGPPSMGPLSSASAHGPLDASVEITWDDEARARMKKIPMFVRGMVVRAVEGRCRADGIPHVTIELLDEIRSRMPTPKVFGSKHPRA